MRSRFLAAEFGGSIAVALEPSGFISKKAVYNPAQVRDTPKSVPTVRFGCQNRPMFNPRDVSTAIPFTSDRTLERQDSGEMP